MYNVPLMSVPQAVSQALDEVLDERTRLAVIVSCFHQRAMMKMGAPGISPSFTSAVTLELNKQLAENERYARFWQCLKELNLNSSTT